MISDVYRNLINAMRNGRGMQPVFPGPAAAAPPDMVDANDVDAPGNDEEAVELLRRTIREINGEDEREDSEDEDGLTAAFGANAVAVRKLLSYSERAKLAEQPVDPAHAEAVDAAAALMRAAGRRHFR